MFTATGRLICILKIYKARYSKEENATDIMLHRRFIAISMEIYTQQDEHSSNNFVNLITASNKWKVIHHCPWLWLADNTVE